MWYPVSWMVGRSTVIRVICGVRRRRMHVICPPWRFRPAVVMMVLSFSVMVRMGKVSGFVGPGMMSWCIVVRPNVMHHYPWNLPLHVLLPGVWARLQTLMGLIYVMHMLRIGVDSVNGAGFHSSCIRPYIASTACRRGGDIIHGVTCAVPCLQPTQSINLNIFAPMLANFLNVACACQRPLSLTSPTIELGKGLLCEMLTLWNTPTKQGDTNMQRANSHALPLAAIPK